MKIRFGFAITTGLCALIAADALAQNVMVRFVETDQAQPVAFARFTPKKKKDKKDKPMAPMEVRADDPMAPPPPNDTPMADPKKKPMDQPKADPMSEVVMPMESPPPRLEDYLEGQTNDTPTIQRPAPGTEPSVLVPTNGAPVHPQYGAPQPSMSTNRIAPSYSSPSAPCNSQSTPYTQHSYSGGNAPACKSTRKMSGNYCCSSGCSSGCSTGCCDSGCGRHCGGLLAKMLTFCPKSIDCGCGCCAAPSCGCNSPPSCGCNNAPSCGCNTCDSGCASGCLLDRMLSHRPFGCAAACGCGASGCGAPSCGCNASPNCGCNIAPSCGCNAATCDSSCGFRGGLLAKLMQSHGCCDDGCAPSCGCNTTPSCGCNVAPSCGCNAAPSCGCNFASACCCDGSRIRSLGSKLRQHMSCGCSDGCSADCGSADGCCDCGCGQRFGWLTSLLSCRGASCCDSGCGSYGCASPSCGCNVAPNCGCQQASVAPANSQAQSEVQRPPVPPQSPMFSAEENFAEDNFDKQVLVAPYGTMESDVSFKAEWFERTN